MVFHYSFKTLKFYTTPGNRCPYLSGQTEQRIMTCLTGENANYLHNHLANMGFRRSHNIAYIHRCISCKACVPIRLLVNDFSLNKTQKRILKLNQDIQMYLVPLQATMEQYILFHDYLKQRHEQSKMRQMNFVDYQHMIEHSPVLTYLIEYRLSNRLVAVSLMDELNNGFSAVYTFYDALLTKRSLGTFTILYQIELTKDCKYPYLYLGYWIKNSPQMAYKIRYQPAEYFINSYWQTTL
ncbi:arginyltransferase [Commensalibacter oyaizuii]|uniref:Aspartate/glutamate leucyltransferase n=1 Tax=Commensalibacter oyaizuii TaxID=3043873 RepID=A0ABT6PZQ0_9PROT|nr:arginyltransferase [Commensalibacter sp. TBRC 16381]MDI2090337.1 arginyltransferase [Commensalibacter sp. TBRC 16381]